MKLRVNGSKKGQMYLIAAIVIITLLVGFLVISNYSSKKEDVKIYQLAEELKIESGKVVDYGVLNDRTKIKEFTKNFTDYAGKDIDIIYIVGVYEGLGGDLEVFRYNQTGDKESYLYNIDASKVLTINLNDINYTYQLNDGENFYFLMSQEVDGERYVARN